MGLAGLRWSQLVSDLIASVFIVFVYIKVSRNLYPFR